MAKRWYVVHVYSGFEKKIAQQIKEQAAQIQKVSAQIEVSKPALRTVLNTR